MYTCTKPYLTLFEPYIDLGLMANPGQASGSPICSEINTSRAIWAENARLRKEGGHDSSN